MTTLTKQELIKKVATLQYEIEGYKATIQNREFMIDNAAAEYKKREEELLESWTIDSKQAIAYIHELQKENAELQEEFKDELDIQAQWHRDFKNFYTRMMKAKYERIDGLKEQLAAK
tara:strand:+ start:1010 stop:1360 length:351 start_codon:yes stop_codon:yes gene_type:complete